MYPAASHGDAMSSGIWSLPPAAFSCPPPLKWSIAHLFADVPFFDRMETRKCPDASLSSRLILTSAMDSGMFTNPSVSPSVTE